MKIAWHVYVIASTIVHISRPIGPIGPHGPHDPSLSQTRKVQQAAAGVQVHLPLDHRLVLEL